MDEIKNNGNDKKFSDYLYILYKWRKFIILNILIVGIILTVISLLIPKTYKANAKVMIPPESSLSLGGLTGLIGGSRSSSGLSSRILGMGQTTSEDVILAILNSRTALENVINEFGLIDYYEIKKNNMDKAIRAFSNDISFDVDEYGMIEISVINKNPEKSAEIANYMINLLDSLNIAFNVEQAKNNRIFIEKRYIKNLSDLKLAEDSLQQFQKKYGMFAIPQQMEVAVKAAAEIESQLMAKEIAAYFMKMQYGENSPVYQGTLAEISLLKNKVDELKKADKLTDESNVFFPFKKGPEMAIDYLRLYREVEIQSKILEIVLPMYEQAKVDEQKSIPTISVLDKAGIPQLKHSPKRSLFILGIAFPIFIILLLLAFRGEKLYHLKEYDNLLIEKEANFYKRIVSFYKIKL